MMKIFDKFRNKTNEKHAEEIYNNYATPLAGNYLNLTKEPALIKCPSCGLEELSEVHVEMKNWAAALNKACCWLYVSFCLCCCMEYNMICVRVDTNHYCQNCSCYFGRAKRVPPIDPTVQKN